MVYRTSIGLDVHARSISACALDNITGEIAQRSFSQPIAQDIIGWASGFEGVFATIKLDTSLSRISTFR